MGETERAIFESLLGVAAALWILATIFTTRRFVEAFFAAREAREHVPFIGVSAVLGLSHVAVAILFVIVVEIPSPAPMWLSRLALYAIPSSAIIWALCFLYLGAVMRRGSDVH